MAPNMAPEILSPLWIAQKIDGGLDQISRSIKKVFSYPSLASIALILSAFGIGSFLISNSNGLFIGNDFISGMRAPAFCLLVLIAAMVPERKWIYTPWFRLLGFSAMAFAMAFLYRGDAQKKYLATLIEIAVFLVFVSVTLIATLRWPWRRRIFTYICMLIFAFFWHFLAAEVVGFSMSRYWIIKSDFFSLLIMSPFLMNQIARNQRSMSWSEIKILLSHVLNPIFLISPIPLSPRELPENQPLMPNRRVDELSEAFLSLCGGITSIVLAFVIYKLFLTHVIHRHLFLDLRIGWIIYLYYYFFWLSLLRLSFSCARLLGYKVPSPSFYALLAANPLDRWKAWNAYLYSWFLTAVFLPLSRTTRSIVFAAAAVFLLNFFFHDQLYVCYVWFYPDSINFELLKLLRGETLFFALHFLMVVIGFATLRFWPPMRTRAGWIGVAVTHLMMAVTHSVVWLNY